MAQRGYRIKTFRTIVPRGTIYYVYRFFFGRQNALNRAIVPRGTISGRLTEGDIEIREKS
jgi:hypothetical protein